MCICRTGFVLQGFHIASCGYLGGADKLMIAVWYSSQVYFLGWPTSVGLERGVILQCWFRGNSAIDDYLLNCDAVYWQIKGEWWHTLCLMPVGKETSVSIGILESS